MIQSFIFFFSTFFIKSQANLRDFFNLLPITFAFVIPALTMRLFSEEFNLGSYEILITMPGSRTEVILSKFLAGLSVVAGMLLPTLFYVLTVFYLGEVDPGPVIGGYLGSLLLAAAYTAIGLSQQIGSRGIGLDKSKPARLALIGSSDMLSDSVVDKAGESMNSIFLMNLLDELNNRTGMARLRSKMQQFNPIRETKSVTRLWIKAVNIAGLPLLVLVFGLLVWGARSRRKKRIRMMFAQ